MARKCGICQIIITEKSSNPPMSMEFVAAVQPINGGRAPGNAPTRVLVDDVRFKGVYTRTYEMSAIPASRPVRGLVSSTSMGSEIAVNISPKSKAVLGDIRLLGNGRSFVLSINRSLSLSR